MRVYHFLNQEHGLEAIRERHLKIARLTELNDPFELMSFSMRRPSDRAILEGFLRDMNANFGVLCFSETATNPVQWAHYGENHRGICLGFDIPDDRLLKVRYVSKRGKVDIQSVAESDASKKERNILDALCTKYIDWKYEKERRVFVRLDHKTITQRGFYFKEFSDDIEIREVIFGIRSQNDNYNLAKIHAELSKVEIFHTQISYTKFRIEKIPAQK